MKFGKTLLVLLAAASATPVLAQQQGGATGPGLKKGDIESALTFEWFKVKEASGNTIRFTGSGGYLFTDNIEAGLALDYTDTPDSSGGAISAFGHWNFSPRQPFTWFAGLRLTPTYFGDEKDSYKNSWEIVGGAKVYPYDHMGMTASVFYGQSNLKNTLPGFGDTSTTYGLRAGFLVKF